MLRIRKFGGIVTQASPYALPPGAAQEQVNFTLCMPGQLTSRRGASGAVFDRAGLTGVVEQIFPFSGGLGQPDRAIVLDSSGGLAIIGGVALQ